MENIPGLLIILFVLVFVLLWDSGFFVWLIELFSIRMSAKDLYKISLVFDEALIGTCLGRLNVCYDNMYMRARCEGNIEGFIDFLKIRDFLKDKSGSAFITRYFIVCGLKFKFIHIRKMKYTGPHYGFDRFMPLNIKEFSLLTKAKKFVHFNDHIYNFDIPSIYKYYPFYVYLSIHTIRSAYKFAIDHDEPYIGVAKSCGYSATYVGNVYFYEEAKIRPKIKLEEFSTVKHLPDEVKSYKMEDIIIKDQELIIDGNKVMEIPDAKDMRIKVDDLGLLKEIINLDPERSLNLGIFDSLAIFMCNSFWVGGVCQEL